MQQPPGDPTRLYIGNLLPHIDVEHLRYFFERFGNLLEVSVQPRPLKGLNFAFVQYTRKEHAAHALSEMIGASIDGQPITIEYARPKRQMSVYAPLGQGNSMDLRGPGGPTRQMDVRAIPELRGIRSIHDLNLRGTAPTWAGTQIKEESNWRNIATDQRDKIRRKAPISISPVSRINDHEKRGVKRKREIKRSRSRSRSNGRKRRRSRTRSRERVSSRDHDAHRYAKSQVVVRDGKRRVVLRDSTTDASSLGRNHSPVRVTNSRRPLSPIGGALGRKSSRTFRRSRSNRRSRSPLTKSPLHGRPDSHRSRSRSGPRSKERKKSRSHSMPRYRSKKSRSKSRSKERRSHHHSYDDAINGGRRVEIRNLSSRTTAKDLSKTMNEYGDIIDAWIVNDAGTQKCKGVGFVDFESKIAVERILRNREPIYILDKKISVNLAKPRDEDVIKSRLHISNLNYSSTSKDLRKAFGRYGEIKDAWIISDSTNKSRGVGFVDFASARDAQKAMRDQTHIIDERQVELHYARRETDDRPTNAMISKRIRLRNLHYDTSSRELRQVFVKFGDVVDAWIVKDKTMTKSTGVGYVEFASTKAASNVMKQTRIIINGRRITAHYAKLNPTNSSRKNFYKIHQRNNMMIPNYANLGMPNRPIPFPIGPPGRMMGGPMPLGMMAMPPPGMMNPSMPLFQFGQPMGGSLLRAPSPHFLGPGMPLPSPMRPKSLIRPISRHISRNTPRNMQRMPTKRLPNNRKK